MGAQELLDELTAKEIPEAEKETISDDDDENDEK